MTTRAKSPVYAIIGAGLGGTLMAVYLARRGMDVRVFERRPDIRKGIIDHGRTINMTIAERGLMALEPVGLRERVMGITMPLKGRLIHGEDGRLRFQRYGRTVREVHHSIKRSELNGLLIDAAEALPNVQLSFHKRYLRGAKDRSLCLVQDERTGETEYVHADVVVGADGAHSRLRREMQHGEPADYEQEYLTEGYKELTIPAGRAGAFMLDPTALHVWPRGECVMIAIPNPDGSFTCTCTMPLQGPSSFAALASRDEAHRFFETCFPDVLALAPDLMEEFVSKPPGKYLTTTTGPWYYRDRIVLLGDACHSVLPFYGQGMNAAFEDCRVLDDCLERHPDGREAAFSEYQQRRKCHTDALARLSRDNYVELKERIRSPMFLARRRIDLALDRWCPGVFATLYSLVTHTSTPYADAVARCDRRTRWLKRTGLDALFNVASLPLALGTISANRWHAWRHRIASRPRTEARPAAQASESSRPA